MKAFTTLSSRALVLPLDDIDTDQIIPARFLKVTDKTGLGAALFADWRYQPDGSSNPEFPLNHAENQGAHILVVGRNFGCGSSREHAPWALLGGGFQAVVSTSFGDIFRNNALKNGFLPVTLEPGEHQALVKHLREQPDAKVTIDLSEQSLLLPDGQRFSFPIDPFSRTCLLNGVDELGYLLGLEAEITAYETSINDGYAMSSSDES